MVAHNVPWPPLGGGLLRLAQVVQALGVGDRPRSVRPSRPAPIEDCGAPGGTRPALEGCAVPPHVFPDLKWRLTWAARRGVPQEVAMLAADRAPRLALREWARPPYDVVWFSTGPVYEWTGRPDFGPTVVDFMDLEDVKARVRAELLADQLRSGGPQISVRTRLARYQARLNARDWGRFQRSLAAQVERVVVPSDLDAARSALSNVTVIPNTYPRPERPAGNPGRRLARLSCCSRGASATRPTSTGRNGWRPPSPLASGRRSRQTEVRLVGRPATSVTRLHRPGVLTVVGQVPSMEEELARASVAVVPVRYGGGTRVKILESFAHRVPVVSTTLGAEGLDVEDGVHLLLADDPEEFAAATVRLLDDPRLRVRLTEAAEALYLDRYDGRVADQGVRRLVEDVARSSTRS